ncbi:MAG: glycosyl transferase [Candidatus Portnoybacteria bacterium RBG_19FT_COMBO_36_7]|uniref:Glycosyl transferase n=1 Tax=Candidatus Portnoybacteria bacterium RBG_19FT_COMBO_36_7 TaxID=1801992 RepID=A0A1G2F8E7_9BACT|nr:MAG: glycosyl transferase [Candidatus Portnoybacteria bacterium RBG_19FT_COMBO_36_7]
MKLSIIVPVYNEEKTVSQIIEKLERVDFGIEKEIIIVDDFSTDGTRDILKNYEGKYKIVYHDKNYGKGRALRNGFKQASGNWLVVQDADLEYDPNDLKDLLEKTKEPGVVVVYGSRRLHHNYFEARKSGHIFALGGIFLTWLANLLYGTEITDEPTCYKMFRTDLLPELNLKCERFEFCPELTAKVAKKGIKIHEVPISYYPRHKGEGKKIKLKDAFEAVWTLLKYRFKK